ncbi:hypothetical protein HYH03_005092 [Edaphochlamys debaryana]|uniref:Uncharacterized protein n=1 Tax=Edaphochlamys debaryana TaxID=47281 RepID=A0A836C2J8_9CHLO|nr:hypothetical protein HYH03_005092 [Edaphochlamys debaryana]|eukprot:KAG2496674.1 hypothetical protein HYH03_005092 [Edaphochlamys debaryana]
MLAEALARDAVLGGCMTGCGREAYRPTHLDRIANFAPPAAPTCSAAAQPAQRRPAPARSCSPGAAEAPSCTPCTSPAAQPSTAAPVVTVAAASAAASRVTDPSTPGLEASAAAAAPVLAPAYSVPLASPQSPAAAGPPEPCCRVLGFSAPAMGVRTLSSTPPPSTPSILGKSSTVVAVESLPMRGSGSSVGASNSPLRLHSPGPRKTMTPASTPGSAARARPVSALARGLAAAAAADAVAAAAMDALSPSLQPQPFCPVSPAATGAPCSIAAAAAGGSSGAAAPPPSISAALRAQEQAKASGGGAAYGTLTRAATTGMLPSVAASLAGRLPPPRAPVPSFAPVPALTWQQQSAQPPQRSQPVRIPEAQRPRYAF